MSEMTKKFEFLEHTGDVMIKSYGSNLGERFMNLALGVSSIMIEAGKVAPKHERTIEVEAKDLKALLYNFIEEIIYLLDAEFFLVNSFKSCVIEQKNDIYQLKAIAVGDVNQGEYEIEGGVKAATYHEMEITDDHIMMVVDI